MNDQSSTSFTHLINLADESLGARALATTDDFFASMDNLLKPGRGEFDPDAYTDRGKLMDGWESRRKREDGHDWCLLRLGCAGRPRLLDIDTNHFLGNHPPYASVDATHAPPDATLGQLGAAVWNEILPPVPLRPGSQNIFPVYEDGVWTHLRLNIYPDGGVARLRVYGDVVPGWVSAEVDEEAAAKVQDGEVDLAAVVNGGLALACSDSFFGPMNNLLLPGRAANMGGGWETRRRRGPGHDWIIVRLGRAGTAGLIELDTNHFKGNYPDGATVEGIYAPQAKITELVALDAPWVPVLPQTKLHAHTRHFFRKPILHHDPISHVRLSIYPDGGVSRLRIYGRPSEPQRPNQRSGRIEVSAS